MDFIGQILTPNTDAFAGIFILIAFVVVILLAVLGAFIAYNTTSNRYEKAENAGATVFIILFASFFIGLLSLIGISDADSDRYDEAVVSTIEKDLGITVVDYEEGVQKFTGIAKDGQAILGRTLTEGSKTYVLELTE